ncbi:MAG: RNB domain-containing ribonuclease [Verrucomicrobia bacterium]|nr:RNB domain-containing ribonuclease [Verrucomicrobiota bacterium]
MEQIDLKFLAKQAMRQRGLEPDFSKEAFEQLDGINAPAGPNAETKDLRSFLWCSIDNDDSKDLDQLTYAENGLLYVAVADVDALVTKDSPLDQHARKNTTSVYTPAKIFPMFPDKLSTDLTSLNENEDRMAIVIEVSVSKEGDVEGGRIYRALVCNKAKLSYRIVGNWLEGKSDLPEKFQGVKDLENSLRYQHAIAQRLQNYRQKMGALTLEPNEMEAKVTSDLHIMLQPPLRNYAQQLIENFMIAANHVMAEEFRKLKVASLRRIVRIPKRWDRIVEIARSYDEKLPEAPDPKALENFLIQRKAKDPSTFPDLSLTVIKLLGRGEYVVEYPGEKPVGHFGLALSEYVHSTAPNRRFPDLISQRQLKAHLIGEKSPYSEKELEAIAFHCTAQEDAATKVERHMKKVAAALFLSTAIGSHYEGLITGAGEKGTWVRVIDPPVDGKIVGDFGKLDVGDRVVVELVSVDIPKGYINFTVVK